ncbi:VOC family protein [Nonomuraea sp. NPDC049158]|uniref:VOC family protein n=1 Tax=Nonomuraea sp. NPDC049158 TaxID=3155649 RepID=UPI0033CF52E9
MLTNIMYVTVNVTDQDRALKFYTDGLGLEKRIDYPGVRRDRPDPRQVRRRHQDDRQPGPQKGTGNRAADDRSTRQRQVIKAFRAAAKPHLPEQGPSAISGDSCPISIPTPSGWLTPAVGIGHRHDACPWRRQRTARWPNEISGSSTLFTEWSIAVRGTGARVVPGACSAVH